MLVAAGEQGRRWHKCFCKSTEVGIVFFTQRENSRIRDVTPPLFIPSETPAKGRENLRSAGDGLEQGETKVSQQVSPCGV